MKILKSTPEKLEDFLQQMVVLGKQVFPTLDRTIDGDYLININKGKDHNTKTSLIWDTVKHDQPQNVYYIKNIMYSNFRQEYLDMIQAIIDDMGLVADDNFTPTPVDSMGV